MKALRALEEQVGPALAQTFDDSHDPARARLEAFHRYPAQDHQTIHHTLWLFKLTLPAKAPSSSAASSAASG